MANGKIIPQQGPYEAHSLYGNALYIGDRLIAVIHDEDFNEVIDTAVFEAANKEVE